MFNENEEEEYARLFQIKKEVDAALKEQQEYALNNPLAPGDRVYPQDGSSSIVLEEGKLSHQFVAYPPLRKNWIIVTLGGSFPTDRKYGSAIDNNCMCVREDNRNVVLFINKEYLRKVQ